MQSLTSCPVTSFSSALDGDARVLSFGTQGRRNWDPPKPYTHTRGRRRVREDKMAWVMRCQTYSLSPPTGNSQVRKVVVATSACIYKYQLATHLDRMINQFSIHFFSV
jgi:hypothetical protein